MRRTVFYDVLIFQSVVILIVAMQYYLIDDYGEDILLVSEQQYHTHYYDSERYYVDYEINSLSQDIWEVDEELDYREKLYVVLEQDETGVYHAVRATKQKPDLKSGEKMLEGKYSYFNESDGEYHVEYGLEEVHPEMANELDQQKKWMITVKLAPWGQKAVTEIEEVEP